MLLHLGHTQGLRAKIRRQNHASQVVRQNAALIGLTLIDNGGGCLRTQTCVPHLTDEQLDAAGLRVISRKVKVLMSSTRAALCGAQVLVRIKIHCPQLLPHVPVTLASFHSDNSQIGLFVNATL